MFVYIYSINNEVVRAYSSETKNGLLPHLVSNVLRDIQTTDVDVYRTVYRKKFLSFDDPELLRLLSLIENNSVDRRFHVIEDVAFDVQPDYFNEPPPAARVPIRAPRRPGALRQEEPQAHDDVEEAGEDEE